MQTKRRLILFVIAFIVAFGFLTIADPLFAASKEKVLYSFNSNGKGGYRPDGSLIFDGAGNLYGTAPIGGLGCSGCGTVFELTRGANGKWKEEVLHSFNDNGTDGYSPVASLTFDAAGNLYGTTLNGGSNCLQSNYGCGTVFELMPGPGGIWTEKVLYDFCGTGYGDCTDGSVPEAALIFDATGNLYGTTAAGGEYSPYCLYQCGTVFKLAPGTDGTWIETVLYSFKGGTDGYSPQAGLVFDAAGNLYGTTSGGGGTGCSGYGCGTVFQLTPGTNGNWTETVLHSFQDNGKDGVFPYANLIFGGAGNLYGTTASGGSGAHHDGTAFQLTPGGNGTWTEKVLHTFSGLDPGKDGGMPRAGLVLDAAGSMYGTTWEGGTSGYGTVFQLTPGTNGQWKEKVLHSFPYNNQDGNSPLAGVILDSVGNLYGTTEWGGAHSSGTVFEVTP